MGHHAKHLVGYVHVQARNGLRKTKADNRNDRAQRQGNHGRDAEARTNAVHAPGAIVGRLYGLGRLPRGVAKGLSRGRYARYHAPHGKGHLPTQRKRLHVEYHGHDAHGEVNHKRGGSHRYDLRNPFDDTYTQCGTVYTEIRPLLKEIADKQDKHDSLAKRRGESRTGNPHVEGKHEEPVAKHVDHAARHRGERGICGRIGRWLWYRLWNRWT